VAARQAHNLKVAGSNPAPATNWSASVRDDRGDSAFRAWMFHQCRAFGDIDNSDATTGPPRREITSRLAKKPAKMNSTPRNSPV
jgi:hypothetical protein